MRFTILGGIVLIALATGAQAKVYKWVDAQGRVHYSTNAPAQTKAQEVKVAPAPPSAQTQPAAAADGNAPAGQDQSARESADADAARAEAYKKNCEIAQQNLKILEDPSNRRFTEKEEQGPVYYTDEQRAAKVADTKKSIETFCGGPKGAAKK